MDVLKAVASGAFADVALNKVIYQRNLSEIDIGLITEISYGAIRQRYFLDCWIDFLGKLPAKKQPPLLRLLLHLGLYQIFFMKKIPASAAVNTTVELAKAIKLSNFAPVLNGFLRSALRSIDKGINLPAPKDDSERIAQNHSLPTWFTKSLIDWKGVKYAEDIAIASNKKPSLDLRINSLLTTTDAVEKSFKEVGINVVKINGCPFGLEVRDGKGLLSQWPGYKEGFWSVQDRSAQLIAPLLDPGKGEKLLDACSAPGGKTTHIAELIKDQGEIWAIDRSSSRLKKVLDNSNRLRLNSINALRADSVKLLNERPDWKGYFQKILLDAPCSGLGTLSRNPDARWRMTPSKINELIDLQYSLLKHLYPLLKSGGRIVYATCTINPQENFKQIEKFLNHNNSLRLIKDNQIWPTSIHSGDGFYSAVIERN